MARLLTRQSGGCHPQQLPHQRLWLADRQTADRQAEEGQGADKASAFLAQLRLKSALYDAKERLRAFRAMRVLIKSFQRTHRPAMSSLHSGACFLRGTGITAANIQGQNKIGAQLSLNLQTALRGQQMQRAIEMRLKGHALLG